MRIWARCFVLLLMVLAAANVSAQNLDSDDIVVIKDSRRTQLDLSAEGVLYKTANGSLTGAGIAFGARFALNQRLSLGAEIANALTKESGGIAALYSGTRGRIHYALMGSFFSESIRVEKNGSTVSSQEKKRGSTLSINFGIDQYLLNGTQSVYPSSGFGFGLTYEFLVWDIQWILKAIGGAHILNQELTYPMAFGVGTSWSF